MVINIFISILKVINFQKFFSYNNFSSCNIPFIFHILLINNLPCILWGITLVLFAIYCPCSFYFQRLSFPFLAADYKSTTIHQHVYVQMFQWGLKKKKMDCVHYFKGLLYLEYFFLVHKIVFSQQINIILCSYC